jgi:three-Cys-motif partner protein
MSTEELYSGREQTLVKHYILEKYIERFAHIIGSFCQTITYVDCFAGPWNVYSPNLDDSSFSIALRQLREAKATYADLGRTLKLRCFFLEKDRDAFDKLQRFAATVQDAEILCRNCELEAAIDEILQFVNAGGRGSFPFIFIDPTGWSGFGMDRIGPLLKLNPGEVLINLMTGHIRRFIESPDEHTQDSFKALFGSADFQQTVAGLSGIHRDDALIEAYAANVRKTGGFNYVCSAIVLHPEKDRTHFHLIYATRDPKGVEVFKQAEKKAMSVMEAARADAQQRKRQTKSGQTELFGSDALHHPGYYESLREHYTSRVHDRVLLLLQGQKRIAYDDIWDSTLTEPLVWESDLKEWIKEWITKGEVRIEGREPKERTPKREHGHYLVWQ